MIICSTNILAIKDQLGDVKKYLPFDAYLFGSRSKIDVTYSDWDFAAEYTEENEEKLVAAGYICMGAKELKCDWDYCDQLSHSFYYKEIDGFEINVILKTDMELFKKVWERITEQFFVDFIWKQTGNPKLRITQVMDQLFEVAK